MKNLKENIHQIRKEYKLQQLLEKDLSANPIVQFEHWFQEAIAAEVNEVNAMTLATVDSEGKPSARIVLLKSVDENGFVFFTNYLSRKGREIAENPYTALVFFWPELERQVRIEGTILKISEELSDQYFNSRPFESKLGAMVSAQSEPIPSREFLEEKMEALKKEYAQKEIERPKHWGGYCVSPTRIEFWQGRVGRLHDRISYKKSSTHWNIERLSP